MREENYYEVKLQNCKDTLQMAKNQLEHFDIQIKNLEIRFEHDKKVYNDNAIHMQKIIDDMNQRIPKLEKQIKKGYKAINIRTGKGYKSFEARHKAHLQEQERIAAQNYADAQANIARKRELLKLKNPKSEEDKEVLVAAEVQKSLQPEEEIKANEEEQLERLRKKREALEAQLAELEQAPKAPMSKPKIHEIKALIQDRNDVAEKMRETATEINGGTSEIEWLNNNHPEWILDYANEREGANAIWRGNITKGFREWCETKEYKLGD